MLRHVIAGLLLLLHVVAFAFVFSAGDQDCYAVMEKKADQPGASEIDYYLTSSYNSLRLPLSFSKKSDDRLYKEDRYSHSLANIFSPPPERTTL